MGRTWNNVFAQVLLDLTKVGFDQSVSIANISKTNCLLHTLVKAAAVLRMHSCGSFAAVSVNVR